MWDPEKNIYQLIGLTQTRPAKSPTIGLIWPTPVYKRKAPHGIWWDLFLLHTAHKHSLLFLILDSWILTSSSECPLPVTPVGWHQPDLSLAGSWSYLRWISPTIHVRGYFMVTQLAPSMGNNKHVTYPKKQRCNKHVREMQQVVWRTSPIRQVPFPEAGFELSPTILWKASWKTPFIWTKRWSTPPIYMLFIVLTITMNENEAQKWKLLS